MFCGGSIVSFYCCLACLFRIVISSSFVFSFLVVSSVGSVHYYYSFENAERSRRLFPKKKTAGSFHKARKEEVNGSLHTWPEPRWGETQSLSLDTPTFGRVDVDGPSSEYDLSIPAEVRAEIAF